LSILEKVSQEDLYLFEILKNPVLCTEFINNFDKMSYEEPFELTPYQREIICDFNPQVSLCCGRAVGKTVSISAIIIWVLVNYIYEDEYIVYTVPNKVHLEPVFTNLIRMFRSNTFLKQFIRPTGGINSGDFTIELLNGAKLMCRIAGTSGTGANVIGLHSPLFLVDEAGYYPWGTWSEMQPAINRWQRGYRVLASGVPTGLREKNVLYHVDQENSYFTKHRITAHDNPRFSEEDEKKALEQYGGSESDDYLHFILGLHGHPVYALFDRGNFKIEDYAVHKLGMSGLEFKDDLSLYYSKLPFIPKLDYRTPCIFGIDLGYTEPTAISILTIDKSGNLRFHARIKLEKVSYPIQEKIIDRLDTIFNPIYIGIDKGSAGISVVQTLQEDVRYTEKNYRERLIPVDFSSWTTLGIDQDGVEIKQKTKPLATSVLQDYSNQHRVIYSTTDLEMIVELERMTYTKTLTGDIIYRTLAPKGGKGGEDHFTSALLCASMAYYLKNDFSISRADLRKKLVGFSWLGF